MKEKAKGQISIFMALVFIVIFTLFGMTVSMTMFVHDKINMQNATDLASYYVAAKQAEMLGAIAHNNYAIRQSWKLLAYRYRVYANSGRTDATASGIPIRHPGVQNNWDSFYGDHSVYAPADMVGTDRPPRVCVGAAHLFDDVQNVDNPCRTINFSTSYIPTVSSIVGSLVGSVNSGVTEANSQIVATCEGVAYLNWWFANNAYASHRMEQRDRRAIINALAENLAKPIVSGAGGMKDLDGQNVFDGASKTFLFNLSESNRRLLNPGVPGPKQPTIRFDNPVEGVQPEEWLRPIYVNTILPYSFFSTSGSGCAEQLLTHDETSQISSVMTSPVVADFQNRLDPSGDVFFTKRLGGVLVRPENIMNVTVGVEKNPWMMIYNKAQSSVYSRPLFLGSYFDQDGIQMGATSYSKPFGGRIGPWYNQQWPNGSPDSNGGGKTDELLPPRVSLAQYGNIADPLDETLFPNYSRYPGDEDGLITNAAMVMAGPTIGWAYTSMPSGVPPTVTQDYHQSTYSYETAAYNDPLAIDYDNTSEPWNSFNRRMEIAAIAPDAFDVTHYSISPGYYDYYIEDPNTGPKLKNWLQGEINSLGGVASQVELRGDIGSFEGERINFDIVDQLRIQDEVNAEDNGTYGRVVARSREEVEWLNTESTPPNVFEALLTGWNSGLEVMDFSVPTDGNMQSRFGKCQAPIVDDGSKPKIPSECLRGGRFGYSVKLISEDYVNSSSHNIGGGASAGAILNPL